MILQILQSMGIQTHHAQESLSLCAIQSHGRNFRGRGVMLLDQCHGVKIMGFRHQKSNRVTFLNQAWVQQTLQFQIPSNQGCIRICMYMYQERCDQIEMKRSTVVLKSHEETLRQKFQCKEIIFALLISTFPSKHQCIGIMVRGKTILGKILLNYVAC